jgi:hypothetical protein
MSKRLKRYVWNFGSSFQGCSKETRFPKFLGDPCSLRLQKLGACDLYERMQGMPAADVAKVWSNLAEQLPKYLPDTGEVRSNFHHGNP